MVGRNGENLLTVGDAAYILPDEVKQMGAGEVTSTPVVKGSTTAHSPTRRRRGTLRAGAGGDILHLALNEDSHHIRGGMDRFGGGEIPADWQTWEKRTRNAEIYRRYLAGQDSVALARAFGLSDRRVRSIIERQRRNAAR